MVTYLWCYKVSRCCLNSIHVIWHIKRYFLKGVRRIVWWIGSKTTFCCYLQGRFVGINSTTYAIAGYLFFYVFCICIYKQSLYIRMEIAIKFCVYGRLGGPIKRHVNRNSRTIIVRMQLQIFPEGSINL